MDEQAPDGWHAALALLRHRRIVALTGAGCSTGSGIPDYRGPQTPPRTRPPIQHREFVTDAAVRQRYWARSHLGWPRIAAAAPNPAHHALATLARRGAVVGLITQNVDGLHTAAGSPDVVELHGALARVRCLTCDERSTRAALATRLADANPGWRAAGPVAPDGDAGLDDGTARSFVVVPCTACGGVLMPDVVFFGGSVPAPTLAAAWAAFDAGDVLLVAGSSLTVFSGYRFVRRAAERGMPVVIINHGPTRGDAEATVRLDLDVGAALPALAAALGVR